jgi:hypothetical protein
MRREEKWTSYRSKLSRMSGPTEKNIWISIMAVGNVLKTPDWDFL